MVRLKVGGISLKDTRGSDVISRNYKWRSRSNQLALDTPPSPCCKVWISTDTWNWIFIAPIEEAKVTVIINNTVVTVFPFAFVIVLIVSSCTRMEYVDFMVTGLCVFDRWLYPTWIGWQSHQWDWRGQVFVAPTSQHNTAQIVVKINCPKQWWFPVQLVYECPQLQAFGECWVFSTWRDQSNLFVMVSMGLQTGGCFTCTRYIYITRVISS